MHVAHRISISRRVWPPFSSVERHTRHRHEIEYQPIERQSIHRFASLLPRYLERLYSVANQEGEADVRSGIEGRSSRAYEIARQTSCRVSHADDPVVPRMRNVWNRWVCFFADRKRSSLRHSFASRFPVSKRSTPLAGISSAPPAFFARNSNRVHESRVAFFSPSSRLLFLIRTVARLRAFRLTSYGMVIRK